jgi:hypothetical protein
MRDLWEKQRQDMTAMKEKHVRWESDLAQKLRQARDDNRLLVNDVQRWREEAETYRNKCDQQEKEMNRAMEEVKRLKREFGVGDE